MMEARLTALGKVAACQAHLPTTTDRIGRTQVLEQRERDPADDDDDVFWGLIVEGNWRVIRLRSRQRAVRVRPLDNPRTGKMCGNCWVVWRFNNNDGAPSRPRDDGGKTFGMVSMTRCFFLQFAESANDTFSPSSLRRRRLSLLLLLLLLYANYLSETFANDLWGVPRMALDFVLGNMFSLSLFKLVDSSDFLRRLVLCNGGQWTARWVWFLTCCAN